MRKSWRCGFGILLAMAAAQALRADLATLLPDDWFTRPPTAERISALQAAADADGWAPVAARVFSGSVHAYELRQEDAAAAWCLVGRWCGLFSQSQAKAETLWLEKTQSIRTLVAIPDATYPTVPDTPMGRILAPETRGWLLGDRKFSESFFDLLTSYDRLPRVLLILQALRDAEPKRFAAHAQLALAIALVYDVNPAAHWPHWQVPEKALPRRLHPPVPMFKFLLDADQAGATLHKLSTLNALELRFLVDIAVPKEELLWARRAVDVPLVYLAKCYEAVHYREDRLANDQYMWPDERYDLATILEVGGICVDRAYFSSQSGKARGVPTLLFTGSGKDGRHAWFGYLGPGQKWVLDAGRYGEQRFVVGEAINPQTWRGMSDHELTFLSEGFRRLPPYRLSRQHQMFAELYLIMGKTTEAAAAARKAVNQERRNVDAWRLLLDANKAEPARTRETLLREAAQAMSRYPDLNAVFVRELAASMRARGEKSAADFEERASARRGTTGGRSDLGVNMAAKTMAETEPPSQVRTHRQLLQQYGVGAGIDFFDRVTRPLVLVMIATNRRGEALQVLSQVRAVLKPDLGSQFDREIDELVAKAK